MTGPDPEAEAFDAKLRQVCDEAYQRQSPENNPVKKLIDGHATKQEVREFFVGDHWTDVLVYNQVLFPHLLEQVPDVEGRVAVWQVVFPEYGRGHEERAYPFLLRNFYQALGVSSEQLPWSVDFEDSGVQRRVSAIFDRSLVQNLTRLLGNRTLGPAVFPLVRHALRQNLGMKPDQLMFFSTRAEEDKKSSEYLFSLVNRYANTRAKRDEALEELRAFFEQPRYRNYSSNVGPIEHTFSRMHANPVSIAPISG
jgi:hypothetical protein